MIGPLLSDLDGTIADTAPAIFHSLRVTCAELGLTLTPEDELSWSLGPALHWCLERLGVTSARMQDAVAIFERAHTESMHLVQPMPGADVVLPALVGVLIVAGLALLLFRRMGLGKARAVARPDAA